MTILIYIIFYFFQIWKYYYSNIFVATKCWLSNFLYILTINKLNFFKNCSKCVIFNLHYVIRKDHNVFNNEQFIILFVTTLTCKTFFRKFLNQLLVIRFLILILCFFDNARRIFEILLTNYECNVFTDIIIYINIYCIYQWSIKLVYCTICKC